MARTRPTKPGADATTGLSRGAQQADTNGLGQQQQQQQQNQQQQQQHQQQSAASTAANQNRANSRNRNNTCASPSSPSPSPPRLRDRKAPTTSAATGAQTTTKQETASSSAASQANQSLLLPAAAAATDGVAKSTTQTSHRTHANPTTQTAQQQNKPTPTATQTSSPCKRPHPSGASSYPTRVLPKRACSLLLAPPQKPNNHQRTTSSSKSSATTTSSTSVTDSRSHQSPVAKRSPAVGGLSSQKGSNQALKTKAAGSSSTTNNQLARQTQHQQQTSTSSANTSKAHADQKVAQSAIPSANQKTANQRNYSRELPQIPRSLTLAATNLAELVDKEKQINKSIVRIELPEPQVSNNGDGTRISNGNAQQSDSTKLENIMTDDDVDLRLSENEFSTASPPSITTASASSSLNSTSMNCLPPNQVILAVKEKNFNILIGVTGSVATIKLIELIKKIQSMFPRVFISKQDGITYQASMSIRVVMTEHSKHFMPKSELKKEFKGMIEVFEDADEWTSWEKIGDSVLHIELRKWADLMLIAPLDANTMAKLSNGICDNLLSCIVRAWDTSRPLIYCPAMNVHMYDHPLTKQHFCKLQSFGYLRVDCIEKRLACGDVGMGAMASVETITDKVVESLLQPVTRSTTMTRPILNQQPTYPIISTSAHYERQQTAGRLFNQTQTNRSTICSITDNLLRQKLAQQQSKQQQQKQGTVNSAGNERPGAVTSVQNLRAINNACATEDTFSKTIHYLPDSIIGSGGESNQFVANSLSSANNSKGNNQNNKINCNDVQFDDNPEFDPANLLEQSMTIGDVFPIAAGSANLPSINNNNNNNNNKNNNSNINDYGNNSTNTNRSSISNSLTSRYSSHDTSTTHKGHPFHLEQVGNNKKTDLSKYNTSQLIALSYNKHRDCFTCALCKHDYKNRKSMARHMKEQHVQGSIFHCKSCGVSFKRREKLIKHNKDKHSTSSNLTSSSSRVTQANIV